MVLTAAGALIEECSVRVCVCVCVGGACLRTHVPHFSISATQTAKCA